MSKSVDVDVLVLGGGPTGLTAAASLGLRGLSVIVVERHEGPFGLPRAGHVDAEAVRILQGIGAHEVLLDDATPYGDYTWYSGSGDSLFVMNFGERSPSHWFSDYTIYQPTLEQGLLNSIAELGDSIDMRYGWEAIDVRQTDAGVSVDLTPRGGGETTTVDAKYLLAADGAGSSTRERLGITRHDYEFEAETWLIVDAEIVQRWPGEAAGAQYCDPRRPSFETPLGRRHHRWEFSLLPGESEADYLVPEKAWELLATKGITPHQVRIVRQQVYRFESRTAERWRDGRILLMGDAAHTMAPFMGQGMCAGLRDVANLSWKLELVVKGHAPESLLDTYESERRPHAQAWADISRAVGAISCTLDPEKARDRDEAYARGDMAPPPPFPTLSTGLLAEGPISGELFPQALVRAGDELGLFDDLSGQGFVLVLAGSDALEATSAMASAVDRLGGRIVDFARPDAESGIHDVDGTYFSYFTRHGIGAALVRPDRYVYGTAAGAPELDDLLAGLLVSVLGESVPA